MTPATIASEDARCNPIARDPRSVAATSQRVAWFWLASMSSKESIKDILCLSRVCDLDTTRFVDAAPLKKGCLATSENHTDIAIFTLQDADI
ncbi:hypothetical protein ElyMa_001047700 [Elysia marginata]|uniref:Uncharacterized protein n=1 Tax=Elysia marginata TaxID=1093978 RepID=A0AAV4HMW0_9GAST|nr:hypothetical protein ElyMa_001047700 [Elysia marginata]